MNFDDTNPAILSYRANELAKKAYQEEHPNEHFPNNSDVVFYLMVKLNRLEGWIKRIHERLGSLKIESMGMSPTDAATLEVVLELHHLNDSYKSPFGNQLAAMDPEDED